MKNYIGDEELEALREVVESQQLWRGVEGNFVPRFEKAVGEWLPIKFVYGVSSGTSANEAMVAGLGLEPGDEVICPATTPIFASLAIFAAGAIPVFAEVDPRTLLISPEGIEERISDRSKAVVVVHFTGQPAQMDEIMDMAKKYNLKVLEDCAEAYGSLYKGQKVGTIGDAACFSLQQGKQITSGEGGFVVTDSEEIYKRAVLYSNCGMPWFLYDMESPKPEVVNGYQTRGHFSFGHNHRMLELQAAVALVQLTEKLQRFEEMRRKLVNVIEEELDGCPGILLAHRYPETEPNYWVYPVQLNPEKTNLTAQEVYEQVLEEEGCGPGFFNDTVDYLEFVFRKAEEKRRTPFGYPLPDHVRYKPGLCPKAEEAAKRTLLFYVHHSREPEKVRREAEALRKICDRYAA